MDHESLTRDEVVLAWLKRGLEDLYLSFQFDRPFERHASFLNSTGLELVCKGYLLGTKSQEYVSLSYDQGVQKLDEIARHFSHNLSKLISAISDLKSDGRLENLLEDDFDGFTGRDLVVALRAAYVESRYPFPINPSYRRHKDRKYKNIYHDPLCSSGLSKFCWAVTREVCAYVKEDFNITIDRAYIYELIGKSEPLTRFCNLLLNA